MATTHYSELKIYALSTEQVENASCEFNVESLQPTYRLLIGVPGKSNAFAISSRLGLSDEIIKYASALVDEDSKSFEDVVSGLEQTRKELEQEKEEISNYREQIEQQKRKLEEKNKRIDKAKDKILNRAREQANDILQEAKDMADDSIRKYNKWMDGAGEIKQMEKQRSALQQELKRTGEKLNQNTRKKRPQNVPDKLSIGDMVMVHSLGVKGVVSSLPNSKDKLFVQMGILRSEVDLKDLELLEEETLQVRKEKIRERSHAGKIKMDKSLTVSSSINLIGKTVDEAIALLDKYLDDAYLARLHQVTIIHGVGTGALRNAVQAHCKKTNYIKAYRLGEYGEGGYGVTVVDFK
jgi:DNA mismatch repair protein MutS2